MEDLPGSVIGSFKRMDKIVPAAENNRDGEDFITAPPFILPPCGEGGYPALAG
jgi:hypothetical protein